MQSLDTAKQLRIIVHLGLKDHQGKDSKVDEETLGYLVQQVGTDKF